MKNLFLFVFLVALLVITIIPFQSVHAACGGPSCVTTTTLCNIKGKGDKACGHWFVVPNVPGFEGIVGNYYWIPNGCSVGASYDDATGKYTLMGACE